MKKRVTISPSIKKNLQKEINSECPFCNNEEVAHFQIHHIDENPSNNKFTNLLMLCPICHSKITKGEIGKEIVILTKKNLSNLFNKIEFINVFVEEEHYQWEKDFENSYIFYSKLNNDSLSPHLTLNWSFINHFKKTIILKGISYSGKILPSGLTGVSIPTIVSPLIKYKVPLNFDENTHKFIFYNQIQVPENLGFQFQTEFFVKMGEEIYSLKGRFYLDIAFEFSNNQIIKIPRLFFNCKDESEEIQIYGLA